MAHMDDLPQCFDGDCVAQKGTQLIGDLKEGASLPLSTAQDCIGRWQLNFGGSSGFPSFEDGNSRKLANLDPTRPGISYVLYSNTNYRPCDVRQRGMARVCDVLLNGLLTETAEDCAMLCTCLRGVFLNAACMTVLCCVRCVNAHAYDLRFQRSCDQVHMPHTKRLCMARPPKSMSVTLYSCIRPAPCRQSLGDT